MATQVQRRRGTASEHNTFTGAAGEVTVNTTNDSVHVHDGATAGGFEAMRADANNAQNDVITNDMLSLNANDGEIKKAINSDNAPPIYACRAWVNFNGEGTVSIRDSGNVSSVTDSGVGRYVVNFATAMPDNNYSWSAISGDTGNTDPRTVGGPQFNNGTNGTNSLAITVRYPHQSVYSDTEFMTANVFR
jgi:hypothetical protein